jgi:hypothetical protein
MALLLPSLLSPPPLLPPEAWLEGMVPLPSLELPPAAVPEP